MTPPTDPHEIARACRFCGYLHSSPLDAFGCEVRTMASRRDGTPIYQPGPPSPDGRKG